MEQSAIREPADSRIEEPEHGSGEHAFGFGRHVGKRKFTGEEVAPHVCCGFPCSLAGGDFLDLPFQRYRLCPQ
jgi:hypothetical protein